MGAGHGHRLHFHAHSRVHRAQPQHKLAALLIFVLVVVATPATAYWAFAAYLGLLAGRHRRLDVPPRYLLKRMVVEVPFLVFAALIPFVSTVPAPRSSGSW